MNEFDYKKLDNMLHSRIRLAIISILVSVEDAEFIFLRDQIGATDGNLNTHLKKLEEAEYISVTKKFIDRKPYTYYKITEKGRDAFIYYIEELEKFIKK
jgi:DNA-binding MarR family transcriptional regulator